MEISKQKFWVLQIPNKKEKPRMTSKSEVFLFNIYCGFQRRAAVKQGMELSYQLEEKGNQKIAAALLPSTRYGPNCPVGR